MKVKAIVLFFLMFVLLINIIGCNQRDLTEEEIRARNMENWERLPEDVRHEHMRAAYFANVFWFDYDDMTGYGSAFVNVAIKHRGYRNIAFVVSQEDAIGGTGGTGENRVRYHTVMLFQPDNSFDLETGVVFFEDFYRYQSQLKEFMEANGWDTPFEE